MGRVITRWEYKPVNNPLYVSVIPPPLDGVSLWFRQVPVIILVDRHTASSAEVFAGTLQHYRRAILVGERTMGKGTIQHNYTLQNNKILHLTAGLWFLPDITSVHERGIEPDVLCVSGGNSQRSYDSCLLQAIDLAHHAKDELVE